MRKAPGNRARRRKNPAQRVPILTTSHGKYLIRRYPVAAVQEDTRLASGSNHGTVGLMGTAPRTRVGSVQGTLLAEAQRLVEAAADPASVEAQTLVERWMKLLLQHSLNSSIAAAQDRNGSLASKAIAAGRMAWNQKALPQQAALEFLVTARRVRMEKGGLENIHTEVQRLMELKADPSSAEAKHMVGRYPTFCSEQYQDDPAGWARVLARHVTDDGRRVSWDFSARAVQLHSP